MKVLVFGTGLLARAIQSAHSAVHLVPHKECDIRNASDVAYQIDHHKPDRVINAAAYTGVDLAERQQALCFSINAEGPEIIAKVCRHKAVPLVHISTDYVFGGLGFAPFIESSTPGPVNIYGWSKLHGEAFARGENSDVSILRVAGLYSATTGEGIFQRSVELARRGNIAVVPHTFCPTAVEDVARAALISKPGLWHFAGTPASRMEIARRIVSSLGIERTIMLVHTLPGLAPRPENSILNSAAFALSHSMFVARPFEEGITQVMRVLA